MKPAAIHVHHSQPRAADRHQAPAAEQPRKAKAEQPSSEPARPAPAPHTGKHVDKSA